MTETRTNTTTVLLLEADNRTANHSRRAKAAQGRHPNATGTFTITPEGIRPTIQNQSGTQLLITADTATFLAMRARHATSGLNLFSQLSNAANSDRKHRNIEAIANEAIAAERERDEQRTAQNYHAAQAERKTTTPAEKAAHREKATKARKAADKAAAKADSLNKLISQTTASDREPLVQAAALNAVDMVVNTAKRVNTDAEADKLSNDIFAAMCAAAGREIANIAAPDAAQSSRTKVKEMTTPEELRKVEELRKAYPDTVIKDPVTGYEITTPCRIPHNVKGATSQCFDTIELRERGHKQNRRPVWCLVSHYLTVAPYISYEAFTEASGGDTAEVATNGGINAIGTQEDAAAIADLIRRANLTEKEAAIVYKVADQTAALHGQYQVNQYWKKRTPEIKALKTKQARQEAFKDAQKTATNIRTAAQWSNAFDRQGVTSDRTRSDIKSRIDTLLHAAQNPIELRTQAEQDERKRKLWERMQKNSYRGHAAAEATAPDYIGIVCPEACPVGQTLDFFPGIGWRHRPTKSAAEAAADIVGRPGNPAPVVRWTDSQTEPQAITPGIDYRAAEVERRAAEAEAYAKTHREDHRRQSYRQATFTARQSRTAYAAHDAQKAALVFWDAMTTAEQDAVIAAEQMTARERTKAAELAAKVAGTAALIAEVEAAEKANPGKTYTAAEVEAMKARAAERAAKFDHILKAAADLWKVAK